MPEEEDVVIITVVQILRIVITGRCSATDMLLCMPERREIRYVPRRGVMQELPLKEITAADIPANTGDVITGQG